MKKAIVFLIGVFFVGILLPNATIASPITFTDTTKFTTDGTISSEDYIAHGKGNVNWIEMWDYVAWKHQYEFDPAAKEVLEGTLTLSLFDDSDKGFFELKAEFALGWIENAMVWNFGDWDLGEVNSDDYSFDINVDYLADGELKVTLGSVWGDFGIDKSELTIKYDPVPEPTTMFLFGLGLLGFVGAGRKRS